MTDKKEICRERGYHDWIDSINSIGESFEDMILQATCKDCGMEFEAKGYWGDE